ncbi:hypothetical protein WA026_003593 [Henosepilachna vigintioctopunctata]|uniref:Uncharacterized protein n=1 Tax=Henosepilachna vigintioctopunctata TaxID=420089 RepID=A0AAW1TQ37_9CUCU
MKSYYFPTRPADLEQTSLNLSIFQYSTFIHISTHLEGFIITILNTFSSYQLKLFSSKPSPISREGPTIDKDSIPAQEGHQEWRKFVGSIRRKVQRHGSSCNPQTSNQTEKEPLSRKNSLTHAPKLGFLKKENSTEKTRSQERGTVIKQHSFGSEYVNVHSNPSSSTAKPKMIYSSSVKLDSRVAAKTVDVGSKGVRKSDKKDNDKIQKPSFNFSRSRSSCCGQKPKESRGLKQDDFLKATMRIFLVVSPPAGKMQVNFLESLWKFC